MKKIKFIIHAGLHKTGTTSIQSSCDKHRNLLTENAIFYPQFDIKPWANHSIPLSLIFRDNHGLLNHSVCALFPNTDDKATAAKQYLDSFSNEISDLPNDSTVLLSGEDISMFTASELTHLKNCLASYGGHEIQIALFVRNPIQFTISNAQELVRAGLKKFGDAIQMGNLQQAKLKIEKFQSAFVNEHINIHNYDSIMSTHDGVVKFFFHQLGIELIESEEVRLNSSMSFEKCLIMSALIGNVSQTIIQQANQSLKNSGSKITPSKELVHCVSQSNENDVAFLEKQWGISFKNFCPNQLTPFDFGIFDELLNSVIYLDESLSHKLLINEIHQDIGNLYPELSNLITKKYLI